MACCDSIVTDIQSIHNASHAVALSAADVDFTPDTLVAWFQFFEKLSTDFPVFVDVPGEPGTKVPSLGWMIDQIVYPPEDLSSGWLTWAWVNFDRQGTRLINAPFIMDPDKTRITLGGVLLQTPEDYILSGTSIVLEHPSDIGDYFRVKRYGS